MAGYVAIPANSAAGGEAVIVVVGTPNTPIWLASRVRLATVGRRVQLELGLDPPEVARLPDAQLPQAGRSMLRHHPASPVLVVAGALLQSPGFLRMDQHLPALPAFDRDALGPQQARPAHCRLKPEGPQAMGRSGAVGPFPRRHDGACDLSRRTGTGTLGQVDGEVILGEVFAVGSSRHSSHQLAAGDDKYLAGAAVAVGGPP